MTYQLSIEAEKDLEKIWRYTFEKWSLEQAEYYTDLLMDEIEYLTTNPKSGQDVSSIRKGCFRKKVESHFIFYRINLKDEVVEIIRILYQQMDIYRRLNE